MKNFLSNRWLTQKHILVSNVSDESHKDSLGVLPTLLFLYSSGIVFLLFNTLLLTTLGYFFKVSITDIHYWIIALVTIPAFWFFYKQVSEKRKVIEYILLCAAIILSLLVSVALAGKFYDLTYDGQGYHQDTIVYLSQGWNPVYELLTPESTSGLPRWKWLNSYPKGSEELSAVIYRTTGKIEQAKAINFVILFMAFGFVLSLLLRIRIFNKWISFLLAILFVWNPVYITQMFSFYIDGQLYLVLLSIIAILCTIYITHKNYLLVPLTLLISLAWSLKLTGVIYSVFIMGSFSVLFWYSEKILFFFKKIQVGLLASILTIFIIGFNPYFTNLIRFHNPFYLPTEKSELVKVNIPENYLEMNPLQRLIISVFSRSDNIKGVGTTAQLKIPFTYDEAEVSEFTNPDNNVGGFGPLFSGIFLFSVLAIIFTVFNPRFSSKQKQIYYFLLITVFISGIIIPPSSYARYIPLFWAFPVIACLYSLSGKKFTSVTIGVLLLILITANNVLISREYIKFNSFTTAQLRSNLNQLMVASKERPIDVSFGVFRQNRIRFAEAGINFVEYSDLPCERERQKRVLIVEIPESIIQICD